MKYLKYVITITFLTISNAYCQMTDLGTFGTDNAYASSISGDGSIIAINRFNGTSDYIEAIIYDNGSTTSVPTLGGSYTLINDLSIDGSIGVGYSENGSGNNIAVKYTSSSGLESLGTLSGGNSSFATAVSDDGSVIAGIASDASSNQRAFKYTASGGMVDIGSLNGNATDESSAYGISGDGNIIVGQSGTSASTARAFKYSDSGGMVDLGTFGGTTSTARGTSHDGSITVGYAYYSGDNIVHAFKHSESTGLVSLGTLGGNRSFAYDVSSDGSITVGYSRDSSGNEIAFKHTENDGMVSLGTLGGDNSTAYDISDDGSIIVGSSETSSGNDHAFLYRNSIVDLDQTVLSIYENSDQLNSIFNIKNSLINSTLQQDCNIFGKNNICYGLGIRYSGVDNHNASDNAAILKLAYKISNNLRIGSIIDQTFADSMPSQFKTTNFMPTIGIFANLNSKKDQSGINLRLSATYDNVKTRISRNNYQYTEAGVGTSNISSLGLLAQASYNIKLNNKLNLIPAIGIRRTSIQRDGYQEYDNIDFPIIYDAVKQKMTTAILSLNTNYQINNKLLTKVGFDFEDNFDRRVDGYVGTVESIGSFSTNPNNIRKNQIGVNCGLEYKISELSKISSDIRYAQQSFNNANNTTIYFNYIKGF